MVPTPSPAAQPIKVAPQPGARPGGAATKRRPRARPPAMAAVLKTRHFGIMASFVVVVILPVLLVSAYMWAFARDQYISTVGFTVKTEQTSSAIEMLGGLTQLSGNSTPDADILYEFIQSQQLVKDIDEELDLRAMFSRHTDRDPVYGFDADGSIEDLVSYWGSMVGVYYDSGSGLIELRIHAFDPAEARTIARAIFDHSAEMINRLSAIAQADATRYAREELDKAVERLKTARQALSEFRSVNQIVDPTADIQGQMGILTTLQQQLATELINMDLLRDTTREGDPRLEQIQRRIEVITARIEEERKKFSVGGDGANPIDYIAVLGEFERLSVDREFAEKAYLAALASFDAAQAEAQRKSRYLAAYIEPTLAETSRAPSRLMVVGLAALFLAISWMIGTLVYYSIRDRR